MEENLFELPKGKNGKSYVAEVTKWLNEWVNKTCGRNSAFFAIAVMPHLLLQKTSQKVKSKTNKDTLARRMVLWKEGNIADLIREGSALQKRLVVSSNRNVASTSDKAKQFRNLMVAGNVNSALRLLDNSPGGLLPLDETTKQLLVEEQEQEQEQEQIVFPAHIIKDKDTVVEILIKKITVRLN